MLVAKLSGGWRASVPHSCWTDETGSRNSSVGPRNRSRGVVGSGADPVTAVAVLRADENLSTLAIMVSLVALVPDVLRLIV